MRTLMLMVLALSATELSAFGPEWVGRKAPDFELRTMDGTREVSLRSLQGRILVIDFWATWCAPCQHTLPALSLLEAERPGVRVVAVNVDDERSRAEEFLKSRRLGLLALYDRGKRVAASYDVPAMPSALIVDQQGIVRFIHAGYTEEDLDLFRKEIDTLQKR